MSENPDATFIAPLDGRALVRIGGADAARFLQGLVTCEVEHLGDGEAAFGALLTPQGKILFDFFLLRTGESFLADVREDMAADFIKRLTFYRLRSKVEIEPDEASRVFAAWGATPPESSGFVFADPRHPAMGWRIYAEDAPQGESGDYDAHRISVGMPEGGRDYDYGDTFPHEALMDQFRGVDFVKGCYVGQEVVSRMQHRGTARKRVVRIEAEVPLPEPGEDIQAGGKSVGRLGGTSGTHGLALVRLDRLSAAMQAGSEIETGGVRISPSLQEFVSYGWPDPSPRRQDAG